MTARRGKTNVLSLRGAALPIPQVNREVVETLESLLVQARDGRVAGIAYATVEPEGHITTGWSGDADKCGMIAGAALLAYRVTKSADDD